MTQVLNGPLSSEYFCSSPQIKMACSSGIIHRRRVDRIRIYRNKFTLAYYQRSAKTPIGDSEKTACTESAYKVERPIFYTPCTFNLGLTISASCKLCETFNRQNGYYNYAFRSRVDAHQAPTAPASPTICLPTPDIRCTFKWVYIFRPCISCCTSSAGQAR